MRSFHLSIRNRLIAVFYGCALLFFLLIYRLVDIQAVEKDRFKYLALRQHIGEIEITGLRGNIYDSDGEILAKSIELPSIAADTRQINNTEFTASKLSGLLQINKSDLIKKFKRKTSFVWIKRKVTDLESNAVKALKLPGVFLIKESSGKRFYPKGKLASHIIGYTGIDDQGLDGVESYYDDFLKGKKGLLQAEIDNLGRAIPGGKFKLNPAECGDNIYLTINEVIQHIAERELAKCVKEFNAKSGCIIVTNVNTGEILALADYPSYSPENFYNVPQSNLRNSAISDAYEPGSTFKVILAAAAIDSGKVAPSDSFYCGNSIKIGKWEIHNANDGLASNTSRETLEDIIAYSFNVGTASVSLKIGKDTLYKYINFFGFGKPLGIDMPGEAGGIVPPLQDWSGINQATISFGQGVSVTPLQLIMAVSAIANGGVLYQPQIVKYIKNDSGEIVKDFSIKKIREVISFKSSMEVSRILKQVIEKGTGKRAQVSGYQIAGKTGTAQICEEGKYIDGKYISSFVGFAPFEDPKIAVLVKIDDPKGIYWGGYVAAPVFARVTQEVLWHLGVSPSFP